MHKLLPSKDPAAMLDGASASIDEIKTAAGVSVEIFLYFYQPVLMAFAESTQTLPLSSNVFKQPGGAFEFGLIASVIALRYAKSQVFFPTATAEDRRILEPQCRFAAFAATLASAIAMTAENVFVYVDKDSDYHPLVCPVSLHRWLRMNPAAQIQWHAGAASLNSAAKAAVAARFIPNHLLQNFDLRVASMIFSAIAPGVAANGVETTLERVVRKTIMTVCDHYQKEEQKQYEVATNVTTISSQAAAALADRMIESARPVEPIDISRPANTSSGGTQPPKAVTTAPAELGQVQPLLSSAAFMDALPQLVKEWFAAVVSDPNYETVKTHFVYTEIGVEVPAIMLGKYGVQGQTIRTALENAKVIHGRTEDGRRFIFDTAVKEYLQMDRKTESPKTGETDAA